MYIGLIIRVILIILMILILLLLLILLILIMRIIFIIPDWNHYRAGILPDGPFRRMGTDGPMGPMTMARWAPDGLEVTRRCHSIAQHDCHEIVGCQLSHHIT